MQVNISGTNGRSKGRSRARVKSFCVWICAFLFFGTVDFLSAQAVIVPANHPVYDWLQTQRAAGRLPLYNHESLPHTRTMVNRWLKEILNAPDASSTDKKLARDFLGEFDIRSFPLNAVYEEGKGLNKEAAIGLVKNRPEPYLVGGMTADSALFGAFYGLIYRGSYVRLDKEYNYINFYAKGAKFFLASRTGFGAFFQADNPIFLGTNRELVRLHPQWGSSGVFNDWNSMNSYDYETFVSFERKYFNADIGRGALSHGAAITDAIGVRRNAPYFTWAKLQAGTQRARFYQIAGNLHSTPTIENVIYDGDSVRIKRREPRWLVIHGLRVQPFHWLSFNVSESIIYARAFDVDYANPFIPFAFSEVDKGDMDNHLLAAETVVRPIKGLELFASLLIDDLPALRKIIELDSTKMIFTLGGTAVLPLGVNAGLSYTRTDANAYTHWARLNTYENFNQPIGHGLGPNAEEWALKLTRWFPYRTRLQLTGIRRKKGLNPVDAFGNITNNVGGDLLNGVGSLSQKLYEGADVQEWNVYEAEISTEPIRGIFFSYRLSDTRVVNGTRVEPIRFAHFVFRAGF